MRLAELQKVKLDLSKRTREAASLIELVEIRDLPGFVDAALQPDTGFLVICGGTGVGKTALLDLLYCGLRSEDNPAPRELLDWRAPRCVSAPGMPPAYSRLVGP